MLALERLQVGAEQRHLLGDVERRAIREARRRRVVLAALERQARQDGRELGRVEPVPDPAPQALADQQVELAVEALQAATVRRDGVAVEVAELVEHVADTVELTGDGVRALLDASTLLLGVALELRVPLGPPGVRLAVGAGVAGVRLERGTQLGHARIGALVRDPLRRPVGTVGRVGLPAQPLDAVAQGRREVAPGLRVARVERLRDPHARDRLDRHREVDRTQTTRVAAGGEHERPWSLGRAGDTGVEDDGEPRELAAGHVDDVTRAQPRHRRDRVLASVGLALTCARRLDLAQLAAQARVLEEVAEVALRRLTVPLERVVGLADLAHHPDDGTVGLELSERLLQQLARGLASHLVDEVDRHVVRRAERGVERVRPRRRETRDLLGVELRLPQHHAVTLDVDAATSRTAGELGVLPRRHVHVRLAVPLGEPLDDDRPGGHVDAERQRLGGEDDLDEAVAEQLLDDLLERGQHAGVVGGDTATQPLAQLVEAEDVQVLVGQVRARLVDAVLDLASLVGSGQHDPGVEQLLDGGCTARAAEHEHDGGQQTLGLELLHHLDAARRAVPALRSPVTLRRPTPATALAGSVELPVLTGHALELTVHAHGLVPGPGCRLRRVVLEEREHLAPHEHVLVQGHGPALLDDRRGRPAHLTQPVAELLGVGDRRRQGDDADRLGQADDDLLPHGAAEAVGEVVHLVHDHVAEPVEGPRARVEHVAQHLGRHDDDRRLAVHGAVARQEPHLVGAVALDEVVELLVGECLDGRRVEALAPRREREVHGELAHDRLARPGGRRHEHAAARLDLLARLHLEGVEREPVQPAELREVGVTSRGRGLGELLGRARHAPSLRTLRARARATRARAPSR